MKVGCSEGKVGWVGGMSEGERGRSICALCYTTATYDDMSINVPRQDVDIIRRYGTTLHTTCVLVEVNNFGLPPNIPYLGGERGGRGRREGWEGEERGVGGGGERGGRGRRERWEGEERGVGGGGERGGRGRREGWEGEERGVGGGGERGGRGGKEEGEGEGRGRENEQT